MKTKFYKCNVCGKQVVAINDTEGVLMCCGQPMVEIETKDKEEFFLEKHMPVYYRKKDKVVVRVGSKFHPATKEHHIEWVSLLTNKGLQIKNVEPYEDPEVTFYVDEDEEMNCLIDKSLECIDKKPGYEESQKIIESLKKNLPCNPGDEVLNLLSLQASACWSLCRNAARKKQEREVLGLLLPMTLDFICVLLVATTPAIISLGI